MLSSNAETAIDFLHNGIQTISKSFIVTCQLKSFKLSFCLFHWRMHLLSTHHVLRVYVLINMIHKNMNKEDKLFNITNALSKSTLMAVRVMYPACITNGSFCISVDRRITTFCYLNAKRFHRQQTTLMISFNRIFWLSFLCVLRYM